MNWVGSAKDSDGKAVLKGRSFSCAEQVLVFLPRERAPAREPHMITDFSRSLVRRHGGTEVVLALGAGDRTR